MRRHDIVVMTVRPISTGAGEYELSDKQLFSDYERELLTRVVSMAEKAGKTVELLVVPGVDPFDAMVQTAAKLQASRLVTGVSPRMDSEELARRIGLAWEKLPEPGTRSPWKSSVRAGLRLMSTWGRIRRGCGRRTSTVRTISGCNCRSSSDRGCTIGMWSALPCGGCKGTWKADATTTS
jgi:nucleotide-binding universal stress UspA family protein